MSKLRLLKLLYLADRQALKERGTTIVGGSVTAMEHGPLHSDIWDLVNEKTIDEPLWSRYFRLDGYNVAMLPHRDPGVDELSPYEIEVLQQVSREMLQFGEYEVAELSQKFEEWSKSFVEGTPTEIPVRDILGAVGHASAAEKIAAELETQSEMDELFRKYS
jgi:uncharacterized phage-associated protein